MRPGRALAAAAALIAIGTASAGGDPGPAPTTWSIDAVWRSLARAHPEIVRGPAPQAETAGAPRAVEAVLAAAVGTPDADAREAALAALAGLGLTPGPRALRVALAAYLSRCHPAVYDPLRRRVLLVAASPTAGGAEAVDPETTRRALLEELALAAFDRALAPHARADRPARLARARLAARIFARRVDTAPSAQRAARPVPAALRSTGERAPPTDTAVVPDGCAGPLEVAWIRETFAAGGAVSPSGFVESIEPGPDEEGYVRVAAFAIGARLAAVWAAERSSAIDGSELTRAWRGDRAEVFVPEDGQASDRVVVRWVSRWSSPAAARTFAIAAWERLAEDEPGEWTVSASGREVVVRVDLDTRAAREIDEDPWESVRFGPPPNRRRR